MSFTMASTFLQVLAASSALVSAAPAPAPGVGAGGSMGAYPPPPVGGQANTNDQQCHGPTNPNVKMDDCLQAVQQAVGTGTSDTVIIHTTGTCQIGYRPFEPGFGRTGNADLSIWAQGVVKDCCHDGACPTGRDYLEVGAIHAHGWSLYIDTADATMDLS